MVSCAQCTRCNATVPVSFVLTSGLEPVNMHYATVQLGFGGPGIRGSPPNLEAALHSIAHCVYTEWVADCTKVIGSIPEGEQVHLLCNNTLMIILLVTDQDHGQQQQHLEDHLACGPPHHYGQQQQQNFEDHLASGPPHHLLLFVFPTL